MLHFYALLPFLILLQFLWKKIKNEISRVRQSHISVFSTCMQMKSMLIERVENLENRNLEKPLELEGAEEDEFSKCRKSKLKYTRALLLELTEVEVCRKLPNDFDLLVLRQLDGEHEAKVESKGIIGKPFDRGPLLATTWDLAFHPGAKWCNHLYPQSKESPSQRNYTWERKEVCQPVPQKPQKDAGVLLSEIQKSDRILLSKTENPYRPPHLNKKMLQPLATVSEPAVESPGESVRKGSADDTAVHEKSAKEFAIAGVYNSTKESVDKHGTFVRNTEGNEVVESSKPPLDEYEDFWRKSEGNKVIGTNKILKGLIEDNQSTFDDFWAEILEIIHLQKEPADISLTNSRVEIHFPDEESLTSVDPLYLDEDSNGVATSEAEISLPDEDSLILIHDMIAPHSSMPTLINGSREADKVTSNTVVDIRKNSKSADLAKRDDQSKRIRRQTPKFSCMVAHRLHPSPVHHSQAGFPPLFLTSNILSHMPSLNSFAQSGTSLPFTNRNTNSPISQYSLFHQPNIFAQQPMNMQNMQFLFPKFTTRNP